MSKIILFNKPFQVLSQFSKPAGSDKSTLGDYLNIANIYPAGRLDYDSEGLLLLTDDGKLQHLLSHPKHKLEKTYWVQIEGQIEPAAVEALARGITLKDGVTQPALTRIIKAPRVWDRVPPIRERQHIPTQWLEIRISEGRNRQVRRMTAAVGHPTLRLIRVAIGPYSLGELMPGEHIQAPIEHSLIASLEHLNASTASTQTKAKQTKTTKTTRGPTSKTANSINKPAHKPAQRRSSRRSLPSKSNPR